MSLPVANSRLSFGLFELDLQTGELWKAGFRVRIQSQPFKVLVALVERAGQIVTREELQLLVWGRGTNVDFDHSLGTAINKIREALGDSAENPRFIETLARRGYRFIAPVQSAETASKNEAAEIHPAASLDLAISSRAAPPASSVAAVPVSQLVHPLSATGPLSQDAGLAREIEHAEPRPPAQRLAWFGAGAFLLALAIWLIAWEGYRLGQAHSEHDPVRIQQVTFSGHLAPSVATMEDLAASATDGAHIYATAFNNGRAELVAVALPQGTVSHLDVPEEIGGPALGDISPDGSRLVLRDHLSPESEQPLWVVPTLGGSALRVGNVLAHDATWMPDGQSVLYANGTQLLRVELNNGTPEPYATLPSPAFWLRWSPDGSLLRFTTIDPLAHTLELWQLSPGDRQPRRILVGFHEPASECCGVWTPDGRWFVFQSSRGGSNDLWRLSGTSTTGAQRVTNGPLQFQAPVASRRGERIYFLGSDSRSELMTLTPTGELVPERGFLNGAVRVEYSHDGHFVAWTDPAGRLWQARADGTERLQLTPDNLDVFLAQWSPDASRLALMARTSGKVWSIYLVAADGSGLRQVLSEDRNAADPSWSPDGQTLVFGRTNDQMGKEVSRSLQMLDLRTGALSRVPGSEGLFSPRWSPNGRYIVALSLDQRHAKLFDVTRQSWTEIQVPSAADPVWSPDSRFIFVHASLSRAQPIYRVDVSGNRVQEFARLDSASGADAVDYVLSGLGADGNPLVRARVQTGDLFMLDLQH